MQEIETGEVIRNLILASAPEKSGELADVWKDYSPIFSLASDKPGFSMEAGAFGLVLFTQRTMSLMWLLGFAAQTAFKNYSCIPIFSRLNRGFDPSFLDYVAPNAYCDLLERIRELAEIPREIDFAWPDGVPHPKDGKPSDVSGMMVFDLLCMSGAYTFLHEVEHVRIRSDDLDLDPHDEEFRCDLAARNFLLGGIEKYSEQSGYPLNLLTTKRAMSIGLASFFLLAITPQEAWGGTRSHPPISDRIAAISEGLDLSDDDDFWIYLCSILLAHLSMTGTSFDSIEVPTFRSFCSELLNRVEQSQGDSALNEI